MKPVHQSLVMKTHLHRSSTLRLRSVVLLGLLVVLYLHLPLTALTEEARKTFASPEQALAALKTAVEAQDQASLESIFGPAWEDLQNPDRVQATNECAAFAVALDQNARLVRDSDTKYDIEVG